MGRFLSVDPVTANSVNGTNFNRYWYGNNNPYAFTDPDGRVAVCAIPGPMQICMAVVVKVVNVVGAVATAGYVLYKGNQYLNENAEGGSTESSEEVADPNGPFSSEDKERRKKGADGGTGVITTETDGGGETSSTTHTVTVDGEVVHQHTDHHGRHGSRRRFPEDWTGREERGEGKQKPLPDDSGPTPPKPEPRQPERWPQP